MLNVSVGRGLFAAGLALSLVTATLRADTFVLQAGTTSPGYDTTAVTIRSDQPTANQNGSPQIIVGQNIGSSLRGLLAFDLTPLRDALAGKHYTINEVQLVLHTAAAGAKDPGITTVTFDLHKAFNSDTPFAEAGVNWNNAPSFNAKPGGTVGTRVAAVAIDPLVANAEVAFPSSPATVWMVDRGLRRTADPVVRFNLKARAETPSLLLSFARFVADEAANTAARPKLVVRYTLNATPTDRTGITYPGDANVIDVKARYGAKGDGIADDTAAIQTALSNHPSRIIYLPNGVYRITDTLRWPAATNTVLQGQSQGGVTLQLPDHTPGYGDASAPKILVRAAQHIQPGDTCFGTYLRNLTIDTGRGNPGAVALQYQGNNFAAIRHVTLRSGDGQGHIGLDLTAQRNNGPALVTHVTIDGFRTGVLIGYDYVVPWTNPPQVLPFASQGFVFEHVVLRNQSEVGFRNRSHSISVRNLVVENQGGIAFDNILGHSIVVDVQASTANGAGLAALRNGASGMLLARNIRSAGYELTIADPYSPQRGYVAEWTSDPVVSAFPSPAVTLNLPVRETPEVPWRDPDTWVNLMDWGATTNNENGDDDDGIPLQAAIDAGAVTIYIPGGQFPKTYTQVELRGDLERIIGCGGIFFAGAGASPVFNPNQQGKAMLLLGDGTSPVVILEDILGTFPGEARMVDSNSDRTFIVKSSLIHGMTFTGSGDVFLDDVSGNRVTHFTFTGGQNVWARQFNPENHDGKVHLDLDNGTKFWMFGGKTEGIGEVVRARRGSIVEVLGNFTYQIQNPTTESMFEITDSHLSTSFIEWLIDMPYRNLITETRNGETRVILRNQTDPYDFVPADYPATTTRRSDMVVGSDITLFTGYALPEHRFPARQWESGYILRSGTTGALKANAGGELRAGWLGGKHELCSIVSFDTSGVPADAVVLRAQLELALIEATGAGSQVPALVQLDLQAGAFGGHPALQEGDVTAPASFTVAAQLSFNGSRVVADIVDPAALALINRAGITQVRLVGEAPAAGYNGTQQFRFHGADAADPALRPQLMVRTQ